MRLLALSGSQADVDQDPCFNGSSQDLGLNGVNVHVAHQHIRDVSHFNNPQYCLGQEGPIFSVVPRVLASS